jgi:hypothetical protein
MEGFNVPPNPSGCCHPSGANPTLHKHTRFLCELATNLLECLRRGQYNLQVKSYKELELEQDACNHETQLYDMDANSRHLIMATS